MWDANWDELKRKILEDGCDLDAEGEEFVAERAAPAESLGVTRRRQLERDKGFQKGVTILRVTCVFFVSFR